MSARPFVPGVPAAGHIMGGFWHPGPAGGCPKCPPPPGWLDDAGARRALLAGPPWRPGIGGEATLRSVMGEARRMPGRLVLGEEGVTVEYSHRTGYWQVTWEKRGP